MSLLCYPETVFTGIVRKTPEFLRPILRPPVPWQYLSCFATLKQQVLEHDPGYIYFLFACEDHSIRGFCVEKTFWNESDRKTEPSLQCYLPPHIVTLINKEDMIRGGGALQSYQ